MTAIALLERFRVSIAKGIKNESVRQIWSLSIPELLEYVHYLCRQNYCVDYEEAGKEAFPAKNSSLALVHQYFQLPCAVSTRQKRADYFSNRGWREKGVFLIGDDDLLSVELCRQGFTNVSVLDCDEKVLEVIATLTKNLPHQPVLIRGDVSSPSFLPPHGVEIVCIDPPYNMAWAELFIEAAMKSFEQPTEKTLVLMINPASFGHGFGSLVSKIKARKLALIRHERHFNAYPVRGCGKLLIWLCLGVFKRDFRNPWNELYFGSDMFEFRSQDSV